MTRISNNIRKMIKINMSNNSKMIYSKMIYSKMMNLKINKIKT